MEGWNNLFLNLFNRTCEPKTFDSNTQIRFNELNKTWKTNVVRNFENNHKPAAQSIFAYSANFWFDAVAFVIRDPFFFIDWKFNEERHTEDEENWWALFLSNDFNVQMQKFKLNLLRQRKRKINWDDTLIFLPYQRCMWIVNDSSICEIAIALRCQMST